ncbi:MAG: polymer-forming cytoskeletal protein [Candidatus Omnitrophica bacterium]|nr:polymer-forming cytoskeletal protein [Candidatus Omnitrophota bacterium]
MALGRQKHGEGGTEKWLEVDASMTGTMTFKDPVNLQINGRFDGTLDTKGTLSIGEKAHVKATIQGESITIAGSVEGQVTATSRVELLPTARLTGKITSPRMVMQDGAVFQGQLDMSSARSSPSTWMTVDELARYLEVDAATVSEWAQASRLPAQREGERWRFERAKIEEWLAHEKIK